MDDRMRREVLAELPVHQECLGTVPPDAGADDPRRRIHRAVTYDTNHHSRMNYPLSRQQGLPITSSLMESAIKRLGRRVNGTEKFWNKPPADAVLQLRADTLSDSNPLVDFWTRWQRTITGSNRYRVQSLNNKAGNAPPQGPRGPPSRQIRCGVLRRQRRPNFSRADRRRAPCCRSSVRNFPRSQDPLGNASFKALLRETSGANPPAHKAELCDQADRPATLLKAEL